MLIGITGPAGAGKTTMAKHLELNHGFKRMSFADPMRAMVAALYPEVDFEDKEKPSGYFCGKSYRQVLQTLGTEWGRDRIGEDFWVDYLHYRYSRLNSERCIIDDVRFENEAALVRRLGGKVIAITGRSANIGKTHKSEQGVFADLACHNSGSKAELCSWASYVIGMLPHVVEEGQA